MPRKRKCPICGQLCRVSADGTHGYCRSSKASWTKARVAVDEIVPGPIRHERLPEPLLAVIRWTYAVVGRFVQPTLDQWELGFMRDWHVGREVQFWHHLAFAFVTYHVRKGLPLRSAQDEARLVGELIAAVSADHVDLPAEELQLLRDCFAHADGWDVEATRTAAELARGSWSPPAQLAEWAKVNS